MLGYAALAQVPFATYGTGGRNIDVTVSDDVSAAGVSATSAVFAADATAAGSIDSTTNTINNVFNNTLLGAASVDNSQVSQLDAVATVVATITAAGASSDYADFVADAAGQIIVVGTTRASSILISAIEAAADGQDSITAGTELFVAVAEAASGANTQTARVVFVGTLATAASAASTLDVLREANVYPEGIQLYVRVGSSLVWGMIDDTQTANWQNVGTAQTPNWVNIDDTQSPDWNQIPS